MKTNKKVQIIITLACLITLITIGFYVFKFSNLPIGNPNNFGEFGDYIGGILNPTLTAFNIMLLIIFQNKILSDSSKQEDKDQIFKLLDNHRNLVSLMEFSGVRGLQVFWKIRDILGEKFIALKNSTNQSDVECLRLSYQELYERDEKRQYFEHYFNNLFLTLKFIDESKDLTNDNKKEYAEIFRCQLSYLEKQLIFIHFLYEKNKSCGNEQEQEERRKKRQLFKKYEVFKDIPKNINFKSREVNIGNIINNPTWY